MSPSYEQMFSLLSTIFPVSEELKKALLSSTSEVNYKKGTFLFDIGEVTRKAFFIVKGIARSFYYKKDKNITNHICAENRIFTSATSMFVNKPAYEAGELLEDSTLIVLPYEGIEKICLEIMELNYIMRKLAELFYAELDQRMFFIHMKDAYERYDFLMQNHPDYFLRVPLGHIASYLGMRQETLSRLRAQNGKE